jgi:hypothetical protein
MTEGPATSKFQLLRGPVLIGAVVSSVAVPYLLQLSQDTVLKITILILGLILLCRDLVSVTEHQLRVFIGRKLDGIILDDFLRSIYDPETGWVASIIGTCAGNATMYALPMDAEQRTKLMQATLWVDQTQARSILSEPGGCKQLLPEAFQRWLRQKTDDFEEVENYSTRNNHYPTSTAKNVPTPIMRLDSEEYVIKEVDTASTSAGSTHTEEELKEKFDYSTRVPRNIHGEEWMHEHSEDEFQETGDRDSRNQTQQAPHILPQEEFSSSFEENPTDPMKVMLQILWDLISDKMKVYSQMIPESTVETVGFTAAAALALHLGYRKNARVAVAGAVEGLFALGLSGAAVGAVATLFTRHAMMGTIRDAKSLQLVSRAMLHRVWQRMKGRWKTMALFLILGAIKKSRRR